jgi:hypothetical protein
MPNTQERLVNPEWRPRQLGSLDAAAQLDRLTPPARR